MHRLEPKTCSAIATLYNRHKRSLNSVPSYGIEKEKTITAFQVSFYFGHLLEGPFACKRFLPRLEIPKPSPLRDLPIANTTLNLSKRPVSRMFLCT
jgi:hypothetical protein